MKSDWGLITTALAILAIALFFWRMEKNSRLDSRQLSLTAALIALGAAGRAAAGTGMLFLQPTMFLPLAVGFVMGGQIGFFVGAMIPLVSNFFMGQGPWTPFQMVAWGFIGVSGAIAKRIFPNLRPVYITIICGCWGFFYGAIMDIWQWSSFMQPTLKAYLALWIAGLTFDGLRALGNVFFCSVLGSQTIKILTYYQRKMRVRYLEEWPAEFVSNRQER